MDDIEEIPIIYNVNCVDHPDYFPWILTEEDIPGAAIGTRAPSKMTVDELKFWLRCRRISYTGQTKAKLVDTVEKSIPMYDTHSLLEDPDYPYYTDRKVQLLQTVGQVPEKTLEAFPSLRKPMFPVNNWETPFSGGGVKPEITDYIRNFDMKDVYKYFEIMATQRHGEISSRTLNRGAKIHSARFVREITFSLNDPPSNTNINTGLFVKTHVFASMKKTTYEVRLVFKKNKDVTKITYAFCQCKAG
jgi:hypothetical protein